MMQSVVALELAERASDEATVVHPSVFRFEGASSPRSRHELTKMETQVGFNSRRDAQRNLKQMRVLTKAPCPAPATFSYPNEQWFREKVHS
jgi:hypothetical protein